MPIEALISDRMPAPLGKCPKCGAEPFGPFLRGQVARTFWLPWKWKRRDIWALICRACTATPPGSGEETRDAKR